MHYSSVLLFASTALASCLPEVPPQDPYYWNVRDWTANCTETCLYEFNVNGSYYFPYPDFAATCSGTDDGAFVTCVLNSWTEGPFPTILSLVAPYNEDGVHLEVSLLFDNTYNGLAYNVTGVADITFARSDTRPADLDIQPTEPLTA